MGNDAPIARGFKRFEFVSGVKISKSKSLLTSASHVTVSKNKLGLDENKVHGWKCCHMSQNGL